MKSLIYISLAVNIVVLAPILVLMMMNSPAVDSAWGSFTESRGILMSIYFAIFAISVFLLFFPVPAFVFALLLVQVIYKVTTPLTVGTIGNPVVISNLLIATFFIITLISIYPAVKEQIVN
ncbi:hypothetical protein AINA4_12980 [Aurantimicrobium sp. INA4]|uniref:hypothetical protein n=1 Tax=Aurantimicrobium sp. INA4 TaxID=2986279 RepID=UPI0024902271|nr:hypothetical protein [Aurantimicrobium sp. INA4]BDU11377.1 hypothetical protein AINA4_12980 [Aurantimicrobium sp. INA4]